MLEFIRQRATGVIAWIIVLGIIATFALWGLGDYLAPDAEVYVAKVDDEKIPERELQRRHFQNRQRLQATLGENFDPAFFDDNVLRRQALDSLIDEMVLVKQLREAHQRIGDEQLSATIQSLDEFKSDGVFDRQRYQELLRNEGETVPVFEARLRRALLIDQAVNSIVRSSFVSEAELDAYIRLRDQQRNVSYLTIPHARFAGSASVSDEDIEAYYQENSGRYQTAEQVSVDYLVLDPRDLADEVDVSEDDLHAAYEARKSEFVIGEQRRASHILIELTGNEDDSQRDEKRSEAQALRDRVIAGKDFAALAKEYSDDAGSAASGGDLGFFGRGVMDPVFEDAVFALEEGAISEIVQSAFGFHIIKLTALQPERGITFDEARERLENELKRDEAADLVRDQAEALTDLTYENPETLSVAAEALDLPIQSSELFERARGSGVASEAQVRNTAFSSEVLQGDNSAPLELADGRYVVLRIKDHVAPKPRPLDEVRAEIVATLEDRAAKEAAEALGQQLLADLKAGSDVSESLAAKELSWSEAKSYGRNDGELDRAILRHVFELAKVSDDITGMKLANGDYALVRLLEIKDGDPATLSDEQRQVLRDEQRRERGSSEYLAWIKSLRDATEISVFEENI